MHRFAFRSLSVFVVLILSIATSPAQDYSYKQYDVKDGLAGSAVYHMIQDKEGFIWFATETGLSRFDGTRFKNFSTQDGLPDNEIIRLYEDRRGRIWVIPFKNEICYFYKGRLYTKQNDSLLQQLRLVEYVKGICENKFGDLLLSDDESLYLIDTASHLRKINRASMEGVIGKLAPSASGKIYISFANKLFLTDTKTFQFLYPMTMWGGVQNAIVNDHFACWGEDKNTMRVRSDRYQMNYTWPLPPVNTLLPLSDSVICVNTVTGSMFFNIVTRKTTDRFLPNKNISHFMADKEGGYWFSSFNEGVFRLSSPVFKSIKHQTKDGQTLGVYKLLKQDSIIWAGSDLGYLQKITGQTVQLLVVQKPEAGQSAHRITSLTSYGKQLLAGCGGHIYLRKTDDHFIATRGHSAIKQVQLLNDTSVLVASSNSLYVGRTQRLEHLPHLWTGRTTCLFRRNDSTWFGTFDGLYLLKPDRSVYFFGNSLKLLRNRISAIEGGKDGVLWVATSAGIVALQGNEILHHFDTRKGLGSNFVRCIGIDSNAVWVGTDRGLNKIDLQTYPASVSLYSSSDGLNSDIINTVLIDKNLVYVGTPEGITWFDKAAAISSSVCDLKLLNVLVNDKETSLKNEYLLPYSNNSIRFDYVAVSMKSAGHIVYNYRLRELDAAWKTTTQNTIEFISLPPGNYTLELYAVNKFGVSSEVYTTTLVIQKPYWQTLWFVLACVLCTIGITWFIVAQRGKAARNKEQAKRRAEQQLQELEQKALRAQMNPHFIFNCLNSIQGFILDKDVSTANRYLSSFARLIRQTLDNSFHSLIPLNGEVDYLTTYLQLEQMRHNNRFQFEIRVDKQIDASSLFIPAMILQPFVENAIVHGLQFSDAQRGIITIDFSLQNNMLISTVNDNGIGRAAAQAIKATKKAAYKGRGMQLTQERVDLMNKNLERKISIEINDYTDGTKKGTEVIVQFPYFTNEELTFLS